MLADGPFRCKGRVVPRRGAVEEATNPDLLPVTLARSASEGTAYTSPRLRFGLVSALCRELPGTGEKSRAKAPSGMSRSVRRGHDSVAGVSLIFLPNPGTLPRATSLGDSPIIR